jgi:predicted kinase
MTKKVVIVKGLPASGKSTWAKQIIDEHPGMYKRVSKDDLRSMLDNSRWSKGNEKFILKARNALILLGLEEGHHVIVDDTNLLGKHEQVIRDLVKGLAVVEIKDFTTVPLETCIERDKHRQNYVGEQVIRKMHRDFLASKPPVIVADPELPHALICDLDGTLALFNGRNPYDASLCESDLLNKPVADIVKQYPQMTLLVSGRKEEHREQTERWLLQHDIAYYALWMRQTDDGRKDVEVKRDIYNEHIKGRYNIDFILDDRKQVVDFWRSQGLTVLQVADGDF